MSLMNKQLAEASAELAMAKQLSQLMWRIMRQDQQMLIADVLDFEGLQIVDAAFDAAQAVWMRHHIFIEPVIPKYDSRFFAGQNAERYLAIYPNKQRRYLNRAQLLMMGGVHDPDVILIDPTAILKVDFVAVEQ
jgi:hypothetical protein